MSRPNGNPFIRLEALIVLGIVVMAGAAVWQWHRTRGPASMSSATETKPKPLNDDYLPPAKRMPRTYVDLVQRTGLQRLPVSFGRRGRLEVKVIPVAACHYGDIEIMESNLKHAGQKDLLLTLEDLASFTRGRAKTQAREVTSAPLFSQRIPFEKMRRDPIAVDFEFDAPTPARWGIFFCIDSAKSGRCAEKEVAPIDSPTRNPDRILYFNALYHEEAEELLAFQEGPVSLMDSTYFLYRWFAVHSRGDWAEHDLVMATANAIGSIALHADGENKLELQLPYYDSKVCNPNVLKSVKKK